MPSTMRLLSINQWCASQRQVRNHNMLTEAEPQRERIGAGIDEGRVAGILLASVTETLAAQRVSEFPATVLLRKLNTLTFGNVTLQHLSDRLAGGARI